MIAAYSFAYAGQPTTSNAAPDNTEDYCDHAEFEALFNVRGSDLITKAKDFIGTPYRYGHSSPSGFDCSGFTSYIYKCLNISLGRSSRDQWKQGLSVNKAEIQVGDLVFSVQTSTILVMLALFVRCQMTELSSSFIPVAVME